MKGRYNMDFTIYIKSLSQQAIERVTNTLGRKWYVTSLECESEGCRDVILNENVILKFNGNKVTIDLGGTKETIKKFEFFKIEIV